MGEVLAKVLEIMEPSLKPVDFAPLNSDPDLPWWRNTAQWARNALVGQGRLKENSPRGIWELADSAHG